MFKVVATAFLLTAALLSMTEPALTAPLPGANLETCADDFLKAYVRTAEQMNTVASYVKQKELPPNLPEALMACSKLTQVFPTVSCNAPVSLTADASPVNASTADFANLCSAVQEIYKGATGLDGDMSIIAASSANDASPLVRLEAKRLALRVQNPAEFTKALSNPGRIWIIDGRTYPTAESFAIESDVRCVIERLSTGPLSPMTGGETIKTALIDEDYAHGYRRAQIRINVAALGATSTAPSAMIECVSQTGSSLTLGDLRKALAGLVELSYIK